MNPGIHKRIILVAVGLIVAALGAACGISTGIAAASSSPDRWFGSGAADVHTATYALSAKVDEIARFDRATSHDNGITMLKPRNLAARAEARGTGDVFIGIGRSADVERYLSGVSYDELTDIDFGPLRIEKQPVRGTRAPDGPAEQQFWVARAEGDGRQQIEWRARQGDYRLVVMSADGSSGLGVRLAFSVGLEWNIAFVSAIACIGGVVFVAGISTSVAAMLGRLR